MIFDVFHIRTAIHDADGLSLNEIHLLAGLLRCGHGLEAGCHFPDC